MFGRSFFYYHDSKELQGHAKRKRREFFNFLRFSTPFRSFLEQVFRGFREDLGVTLLYTRPQQT